MFSLTDSRHRYAPPEPTLIMGAARSAALTLQRSLRLFPKEFCLISGAPRSGTSALCEWLGHQQGVSAFPESRILIGSHRFMEESARFQNLDQASELLATLARHLVSDYYASSRILVGKRILVDKEPLEPIALPLKDYQRFIFNVRRLFPQSKLLLAVRDPIATVWSMTQRTWGSSLTETETRRFTLQEYAENWCACAELILQYRCDPRTCIIQFGCLVNDSERESRRILDFLGVRHGISFRPRETKEIGFSDGDRQQIMGLVQPQLERLHAQGIWNLC